MAIPAPEPGLVINYSYLWHHEHESGADEGRKDRPAVVVLCVEGGFAGETTVTVLPITHRRPRTLDGAVEIPAAIKRHLGLDDDPSWIIVSEGNDFVWPGYDLRRRADGGYVYGFLPPRFFNRVRDAFVAIHRKRNRSIWRD